MPSCDALIKRLTGCRVGVLAHAASVNHALRHVVDVMRDLGVRPTLLFGPEHGFGGAAQDMASVTDALDPKTGARIISLYGDSLEALIPNDHDLSAVDMLVVDLTDVGARYYTYVWTALLAVRTASRLGVHCVLLDRPNPIGGQASAVEGRVQEDGFTSFVGWEPVPIRHSLTYGEMVVLHLLDDGTALGPDGAVSALATRGWSRDDMADGWDRPFVLPSPNMPTLDTALVYPGGCLIEGTNLSEGRGHTRPFEFIGAPFVDGERLASDLGAAGLEGFAARAVSFMPTFHKHAGEVCGGVQIHVTDRQRFRPVATYAALITLCHHQAPKDFAFRTEAYEFVDDIPAFDLLTGSSHAREMVEAGASARDVAAHVSQTDRLGWSSRMDEAAHALAQADWKS